MSCGRSSNNTSRMVYLVVEYSGRMPHWSTGMSLLYTWYSPCTGLWYNGMHDVESRCHTGCLVVGEGVGTEYWLCRCCCTCRQYYQMVRVGEQVVSCCGMVCTHGGTVMQGNARLGGIIPIEQDVIHHGNASSCTMTQQELVMLKQIVVEVTPLVPSRGRICSAYQR